MKICMQNTAALALWAATFVHYRKGWLLNPNPEPQEHWFKGKAKT